MALIKCKECGKDVSTKAKACPSCGAEGWNEGKFWKRYLWGVVFVLFILNSLLSTDEPEKMPTTRGITSEKLKNAVKKAKPAPKKKSWKKEDNSTSAYTMVKAIVRSRLKSPSTAEFLGWGMFSDEKPMIAHIGDQTYLVNAWVDHQNVFGATIRTHFAAEIRQISRDQFNGKSWKLISLDLR